MARRRRPHARRVRSRRKFLNASQKRLHLVPGCARHARHRDRHAFQHERICARQSWRRLLFHETAGRLARRWTGVCVLAALIDYHFWQRTWWIWFASGRWLLWRSVSFRTWECGLTVRVAGLVWVRSRFQPSEIAKVAAVFFLAAWFSRYEKAERPSSLRFRYSACHRGSLLLVDSVRRSISARRR